MRTQIKILVALHALAFLFAAAVTFSGGFGGVLELNNEAVFVASFLMVGHLVGVLICVFSARNKNGLLTFVYELVLLVAGMFFLSLDLTVFHGVAVLISGAMFFNQKI